MHSQVVSVTRRNYIFVFSDYVFLVYNSSLVNPLSNGYLGGLFLLVGVGGPDGGVGSVV